MKSKKLISLILSAAMVVSWSACMGRRRTTAATGGYNRITGEP